MIGALVAGAIAAPILVEGVRFIDSKLRIDDPVGAVTVHGFCGIWGTMAVGLLDTANGLFYSGSATLLAVQAIGVVAVIAWTSITIFISLSIIKLFIPLRVPREEEMAGLDSIEHGANAYEFQDSFKGVQRSGSFAERLTTLGSQQNASNSQLRKV